MLKNVLDDEGIYNSGTLSSLMNDNKLLFKNNLFKFKNTFDSTLVLL